MWNIYKQNKVLYHVAEVTFTSDCTGFIVPILRTRSPFRLSARSQPGPSSTRCSLGKWEQQRPCAPEAETEPREEGLAPQSISAHHQPSQRTAVTRRHPVFNHHCRDISALYNDVPKMSLLNKQWFPASWLQTSSEIIIFWVDLIRWSWKDVSNI